MVKNCTTCAWITLQCYVLFISDLIPLNFSVEIGTRQDSRTRLRCLVTAASQFFTCRLWRGQCSAHGRNAKIDAKELWLGEYGSFKVGMDMQTFNTRLHNSEFFSDVTVQFLRNSTQNNTSLIIGSFRPRVHGSTQAKPPYLSTRIILYTAKSIMCQMPLTFGRPVSQQRLD